jgi:adenylyltransferase/sulfurtransferase
MKAKYSTKLIPRLLLWFIIISGILMVVIIYNPDLLKPLIQSGVPLTNFSGIPVLGDAIRAANTPQITVQELKKLIDDKDQSFVLVDVRSLEEYEYTHIPGAIFVPLTDIEQGTGITKIKSLISGHKLITYCSVGKRSNKALELLKNAGIDGTNVKGGIHKWRENVDPSMPEL